MNIFPSFFALPPGLALAAAVGAGPALAGFCGNYIQISSNAGECADCRLLIAENPEIQKYFVEANNGWSAEMTWTHGDSSTATGGGLWNDDVGHGWAGRAVDIDMSQQGLDLTMIMSAPGAPDLGAIRATYRCLDPS